MTETTVEERIGARIDPGSAKEIAVRESAGGIAFTNAAEMMEGAKLLAVSGEMIPKHLRGKPGACFAIIMQAYEWKLSPIQVANKSYFVNDRVAYEAQLVAAVALQRAPIKGRPRYEFEGTGDALMCRVSVEMMEGGSVEYESPPLGQIHPRNSPLWKSDPRQQLGYYSIRALCRRHFPDVLLGIYARDELEDSPRIGPDRAWDVTPAKTISEKLDALTKAQDAVPDPADDYSAPVPHFVSDEFAGYIPPLEPPTEPDMFEPVRELARADAEKKLRRMAPTKLSEEEKTVYLQAFDAHRTAMAE
jgi:hypothetical protein